MSHRSATTFRSAEGVTTVSALAEAASAAHATATNPVRAILEVRK